MKPATPHPAAVSAAKELVFSNSSLSIGELAEIIACYYAPVLEEKDKRIAELEEIRERSSGLESQLSSATTRIAELEAQCAAKDAALKQVTEGRILCADSMDFDDETMERVHAALSPTCSAGWLSPQEAEKLKQDLVVARALLDSEIAAASDRERQAQIRTLKWVRDRIAYWHVENQWKLEQLRAGGQLL